MIKKLSLSLKVTLATEEVIHFKVISTTTNVILSTDKFIKVTTSKWSWSMKKWSQQL